MESGMDLRSKEKTKKGSGSSTGLQTKKNMNIIVSPIKNWNKQIGPPPGGFFFTKTFFIFKYTKINLQNTKTKI